MTLFCAKEEINRKFYSKSTTAQETNNTPQCTTTNSEIKNINEATVLTEFRDAPSPLSSSTSLTLHDQCEIYENPSTTTAITPTSSTVTTPTSTPIPIVTTPTSTPTPIVTTPTSTPTPTVTTSTTTVAQEHDLLNNIFMNDPSKRDPCLGPKYAKDYLLARPYQPNIKFPTINRRHFCYPWFQLYKWLEFSEMTNRAYCFINAVKNHKNNNDVAKQLNRQHEKQASENRLYLQEIIRTILLLARQGLALRGHREDEESENKGNLLELLELRSFDNDLIKSKFKSLQYTHHSIQNELLCLIHDNILSQIVFQIKSAKYFSIMMDESVDIFRHEQVSLVIRHADDQFHVYERFIGFQRASSTTGEALFKLLVMWLKQLDLDINNIVGQCFDGASAMSSGVTRAKLIDFGKAHTLTSATINQINELRSGKEFSRLLAEITEFCVENNIDLSVNVNKTTISTRFKNCSVTSTIGQCEEIDNESEYTDFDFYPLSNEIQELKPMLKQSKSKDIGDLSFEVLPLDQAFSKIIYLAISALTIPMFSTTTERAFSK
ncbi:unnamed protein product [Rotaria socialis]|uniref:DUF4371 domain-containing protein n=1 Tax=Rotaria socialis TaxID=392032 RepID=A0A817WI16_9BILA|nr:unnamed protein product [Rotaria socialis]